MSKPIVAIVGRPNVGKSTFFNKVVGKRISIIDDSPGVTRDRIYAPASWLSHEFMLVDTGGIEPKTNDIILSQMKRQAELAIETADVIIFLTDIKDGLVAADKEIAAMLQKSGKPVVLACNKVDSIGEVPMELYEFYNLGLGEPFPVSSVHGLGMGDFLDEVVSHFKNNENDDENDDFINVAVIGKPNVGKSSLINYILGEDRLIVSNIAGTTRDAIDTKIENEFGKFTFIDTAGMRKKGKIDEDIERYSVIRSLAAIDRADVCLMLVDATQGVTEQDSKIAGYAHDNGKPSVILVNKWDAVSKETNTMSNFKKDVADILSFMQYAPQLYISAKTGQRIDKIFEMINYVATKNTMRVTTGKLNDVINEAVYKVQPPSDKGKRLKVYYATQVSTKPPTFAVFVNDKKLMHFSYLRYLENQIRETFSLDGTPLKFFVREKKDDK